jgi:hypothetical protein
MIRRKALVHSDEVADTTIKNWRRVIAVCPDSDHSNNRVQSRVEVCRVSDQERCSYLYERFAMRISFSSWRYTYERGPRIGTKFFRCQFSKRRHNFVRDRREHSTVAKQQSRQTKRHRRKKHRKMKFVLGREGGMDGWENAKELAF